MIRQSEFSEGNGVSCLKEEVLTCILKSIQNICECVSRNTNAVIFHNYFLKIWGPFVGKFGLCSVSVGKCGY